MRAATTPALAAALGVALAGALGPTPASGHAWKLATWNLDWLTLRPTGDPALPDDVAARSPADWTALAAEARRLDADVVAIEEVDGPAAARRLFPPDRYDVIMTNDDVVQRVGLAVRHGLAVTRHPDLVGLDVEPDAVHRLRSGLDVTLALDGRPIRLLVVHLKTGCWGVAEDREDRRACRLFRRQVAILAGWIAARRADGGAFAVVGDFNRHLADPDDPVLGRLGPADALADPELGHASPCWGGEDFIDHVLLGGPARGWVEPGSLRVLVYRDHDPADKDRLSDHCPVSARLDPSRP